MFEFKSFIGLKLKCYKFNMWTYIKYANAFINELKFYGMSKILFQHNVLKECVTRNIKGRFCTSIIWKMMTINSIFIPNFRNNLKFPDCHDNVLIASIFFVYYINFVQKFCFFVRFHNEVDVFDMFQFLSFHAELKYQIYWNRTF